MRYRLRRFLLLRHTDTSQISGTGIIAQGVQFHDGTCVLNWLTKHHSLGIYPSIQELESIHGHNGGTEVIFVDSLLQAEVEVPVATDTVWFDILDKVRRGKMSFQSAREALGLADNQDDIIRDMISWGDSE